jgi:hypothetical protein
MIEGQSNSIVSDNCHDQSTEESEENIGLWSPIIFDSNPIPNGRISHNLKAKRSAASLMFFLLNSHQISRSIRITKNFGSSHRITVIQIHFISMSPTIPEATSGEEHCNTD